MNKTEIIISNGAQMIVLFIMPLLALGFALLLNRVVGLKREVENQNKRIALLEAGKRSSKDKE